MAAKSIVSGLPKPATPALLIRMSTGSSCSTASTSRSLVTSNRIGVTRSRLSASRSLRLRIPAITSAAPASTNAVTNARPSPRLAPVISTRLPSICMCVDLTAALHSCELVKSRADDAPNQYQFNARQRLAANALAQRLRPQNLNILAQLNHDHQTHRDQRYNCRRLLRAARQVDFDLARKARIQPREKQKY